MERSSDEGGGPCGECPEGVRLGTRIKTNSGPQFLREQTFRDHPRTVAEVPTAVIGKFYSITSSAMASSVAGTVRLSILAVCALTTSSNFAACATGRSAGLVPLRMRPA